MRKILSLLFLMSVILLSCGEEERKAPAGSKGNAGKPQTPPASKETQILTTNYWVFEHYISSSNFQQGKSSRGKWFLFKKDGTFESGHWEQKLGGGSWYLTLGGQYPVLVIDSFNDADDTSWQLQGIPEDGSEMSWVGSADYPNYGDLTKMLNLLTPPTKKQFGDE